MAGKSIKQIRAILKDTFKEANFTTKFTSEVVGYVEEVLKEKYKEERKKKRKKVTLKGWNNAKFDGGAINWLKQLAESRPELKIEGLPVAQIFSIIVETTPKSKLLAIQSAIESNVRSQEISNSRTAIDTRNTQIDTQDESKKKISTTEALSLLTMATSPVSYLLSNLDFISDVMDSDTVVFGPLPLGRLNVPNFFGAGGPCALELVEVSQSNQVVKFRGTGTVFLAHQEGGRNAVKIRGRLFGENKWLYFMLLWILTLMGQGQVKVVDGSRVLKVSSIDKYLSSAGTISQYSRFQDILLNTPKETIHICFPLVTKHIIIPNCYIETFSYEETVETGKDVIVFDLFLRTYLPSTKYYKDKEYYVEGGFITAGLASRTEQLINSAFAISYQISQFIKERYILDDASWKVKNYYDLDPSEVVNSAVFSDIKKYFKYINFK